MKYTTKELIYSLQKEYMESEIIPKSTCNNRVIHKNQFIRRFGSWTDALLAAHIPLRKQLKPIVLEKECPTCNETFTAMKTKERTFCSVQCSNTKRKKLNRKPVRTRSQWLIDIRKEAFYQMVDADFNDLSWDTKRKRVIHEQVNKCNKCGIDEWLGNPISLEVDHIDGDNTNDIRDNLEGLCPNCHSITPTWRGRNKASTKISDDELLRALIEKDNIRQALLAVGMAAKGANYRRATRLLKGLNTYERII